MGVTSNTIATQQKKQTLNSNLSPITVAQTQQTLQTFRTLKADNSQAHNIEAASEAINHQILSCFSDKLNVKDLKDAQREIEESVKALTKAALLELKSMSKPHPLVEKTLSIVAAIRGFKQLNWNTSKEMISRQSFKMELMQVDFKTLRPTEVLRAQGILTQKTNSMLTPENVQLHSEGAALLLIWTANMIKMYAICVKIGIQPEEHNRNTIKLDQNANLDDFHKISTRTKVMLKKEQNKDKNLKLE